MAKEIREKYGEDQVRASNEKFKNMTAEQYAEFEKLGATLTATLNEALRPVIQQVSWPRRLPICTVSGSATPGAATVKKHTLDWLKCM